MLHVHSIYIDSVILDSVIFILYYQQQICTSYLFIHYYPLTSYEAINYSAVGAANMSPYFGIDAWNPLSKAVFGPLVIFLTFVIVPTMSFIWYLKISFYKRSVIDSYACNNLRYLIIIIIIKTHNII